MPEIVKADMPQAGLLEEPAENSSQGLGVEKISHGVHKDVGMGSTVFTGITGKILPSRGRSREDQKIKPSGRKFSVPFTK